MESRDTHRDVLQSLVDVQGETNLAEAGTVVPLLDTPASNPGLNFKEKAESLANLINNAVQGQLTLGIFGGYGTGKTTLMEHIKSYLDSEAMKPSSNLITLDFKSWRYDHEACLFLPFLCTLRRAKDKWKGEWSDKPIVAAMRGFLRGTSFELNLGITKFSFTAKDALEAEKQLLEDRLTKAAGEYEDVFDALRALPLDNDDKVTHRIVVFVDDLDRCLPEKAFALLEQLKSLMDMKGYMFVIGLDERVVSTYLKSKYREYPIEPQEYIQKLFQVSVRLPLPGSSELAEELSRCLKTSSEQWINDWAKEMDKLISTRTINEYLPATIREGKRILNAHQAVMAIADKKDKLNSRVLLAILIVRSRWPDTYHVMKEHTSHFMRIMKVCFDDTDRGLPAELKDNTELRSCLKKVYPFAEENLKDIKTLEPYLKYLG